MIDPRSSVHLLCRRTTASSMQDDEQDDNNIVDDEQSTCSQDHSGGSNNNNNGSSSSSSPSRPIHLGLEYEAADEAAPPAVFDVLLLPCNNQQQQQSKRRRQQEERTTTTKLWTAMSFLLLVVAGTGNSVSAKLQAIPMYNYPNFLNLFSIFSNMIICFAYIIPVSRNGWFGNPVPVISPDHWSLDKRQFAIMGALDGLAHTMQVFAAVYLPGPMLVLLSQATIPISMLLTSSSSWSSSVVAPRHHREQRYHWTHYAGAALVLVGILVVLEPVVTQRLAPDFYCQAVDLSRDCSVCQAEIEKESCLVHTASSGTGLNRFLTTASNVSTTTPTSTQLDYSIADEWIPSPHRRGRYSPGVDDDDAEDDDDSLCQWLPWSEARREKEGLVLIWSMVMLAACIPMTLSAILKQRALQEYNLDPIFLNGWTLIFQFLVCLVVAVPAGGMVSSPAVRPADLLRNLWNGARCYVGVASIHGGCHPDELCRGAAPLLVNLAVGFHALYTYSTTCVLKYVGSSLFFLSLTVVIPVSNLAFGIVPVGEPTVLRGSDLTGLLVILVGLLMYQVTNATTDGRSSSGDDDDDDDLGRLSEESLPTAPTSPSANETTREGGESVGQQRERLQRRTRRLQWADLLAWSEHSALQEPLIVQVGDV